MGRYGRWFGALAAGVLMVGALAGCSRKSGPTTSGSGAEPSAAVTTPLAGGELAALHGTRDVSAESAVELEMDDFYFSPTVLTGEVGQTLKLELRNEGRRQHNLTQKDQSIDTDVQPGKTADVTVTFPASGALTFFCAYHGAAYNMRGQLQTKS